MPYIQQSNREKLHQKNYTHMGPGEWNYLYTCAMIRLWENDPHYRTIHLIKLAVQNPTCVTGILDVETILAHANVSIEDRQVARDLAFSEFQRRIVYWYEDLKAMESGDVYRNVPGIPIVPSNVGAE